MKLRSKANPGKIIYASAGNGTLNHLAPEMLKAMAGIDMVHVPYKGAVAALADVISGREQLYIKTEITKWGKAVKSAGAKVD
jgi:tripartite-type tricarboxylate transporter receptor subunit TctC